MECWPEHCEPKALRAEVGLTSGLSPSPFSFLSTTSFYHHQDGGPKGDFAVSRGAMNRDSYAKLPSQLELTTVPSHLVSCRVTAGPPLCFLCPAVSLGLTMKTTFPKILCNQLRLGPANGRHRREAWVCSGSVPESQFPPDSPYCVVGGHRFE
jgi:hypothetical protein